MFAFDLTPTSPVQRSTSQHFEARNLQPIAVALVGDSFELRGPHNKTIETVDCSESGRTTLHFEHGGHRRSLDLVVYPREMLDRCGYRSRSRRTDQPRLEPERRERLRRFVIAHGGTGSLDDCQHPQFSTCMV